MTRIKKDCVTYTIVFSLFFALPLFGCAQNVAVRKPVTVASAEITKQTIKKDPPPVKEETESNGQKEENSFSNFNSNGSSAQQSKVNEEEQDLMEKALDLLEVADTFWKKGDVENTLNALDKAYALVLDTNGDVDIARQKDDLRLLISKRILSVYSAKQTVTNGKASEIPLTMNADVEKEIRSFQVIERDFFISSYQRSGLYRSIILKELKKAGIPEELFWLPLVESGFKIQAYSRARALGLWQFIPSTGYKFGLSRNEWIDERMDVEKSTLAAIAYLKELHNMFGDWLTVLAAYNCGEGRVLRVISRQHINYFDGFWDLYHQLPQETARYVPRFLATLHIIKNPQKYGINLDNAIEKPITFSMVKVNKVMKLHDIAAKIGVSDDVMNLLNSELRYKITPNTEYELNIPTEALAKFNLVSNEIPESEKPRVTGRTIFTSRTVFTGRTVFIKHRVKSGETIASIAKRYKVSPATITSYNNKSTKKRLVVGKMLNIPIFREARSAKNKPRSKNRRTQTVAVEKKVKVVNQTLSAADMNKLGTNKHIVTKGENLSIIARKNNTTSANLKQLNKFSGKKLNPGQVLIIK